MSLEELASSFFFYLIQFLSNFKYLSSNFLSSYLNKILAIYFFSNSLFLNSVSRFNFISILLFFPFTFLSIYLIFSFLISQISLLTSLYFSSFLLLPKYFLLLCISSIILNTLTFLFTLICSIFFLLYTSSLYLSLLKKVESFSVSLSASDTMLSYSYLLLSEF